MLLHLVEAMQIDHSSRANLGGDERNSMLTVLIHRKALRPFSLLEACLKRVSKKMVILTNTHIRESLSYHMMSTISSLQARWLDIEYF